MQMHSDLNIIKKMMIVIMQPRGLSKLPPVSIIKVQPQGALHLSTLEVALDIIDAIEI